MKVINNEHIICADIDDTILCWDKKYKKPGKNKIKVIDPYTKDILYLTPHEPHIRLLRQYKGRGYFIVAWSKAGAQYVESVITTLKLKNVIDICMTKPDKHIDDKVNIEDIIGTRVYLKNNI